jgi:hypothetical protein
MVRAIMAGTKTQTRRVVKSRHWPEPLTPGYEWFFDQTTTEQVWEVGAWNAGTGEGQLHSCITCPYGKPGDRLWVRETWAVGDRDNDVLYAADPSWNVNGVAAPPPVNKGTVHAGNWHPSIHMPRWASRLTLEVTSVDVQRLQDISEADARAEGITDGGCLTCGNNEPCGCGDPNPAARDSFVWLWDSINAERGYGWSVNPFVWVVEFKVVGAAKGGAAE